MKLTLQAGPKAKKFYALTKAENGRFLSSTLDSGRAAEYTMEDFSRSSEFYGKMTTNDDEPYIVGFE